MQPHKSTWKLVTEYGVSLYACGLRAGDHTGTPTGVVHPAGEVWIVLSGSKDDPGVVWFRQKDGERHTWDDDAAQIDEWFTRLGPAA